MASGSPLGNNGLSWSDQLLGAMPNVYVYAANNPSESIVAKRRGYGTIVSHNGACRRSRWTSWTAELRRLLAEYREDPVTNFEALRGPVFGLKDVRGPRRGLSVCRPRHGRFPRVTSETLETAKSSSTPRRSKRTPAICTPTSACWRTELFSEGLHTLGEEPTEASAAQYLGAYFGERLSEEAVEAVAKMRWPGRISTTCARRSEPIARRRGRTRRAPRPRPRCRRFPRRGCGDSRACGATRRADWRGSRRSGRVRSPRGGRRFAS